MMCCSLCKLMSFPRVAVMVSLSRDSRDRPEGASREKRSKMRLINTQIKLCCKETLGNACVNWLLMLYYKCRSRNGLGSPFGIETSFNLGCAWKICKVGMAWEARSGLKQTGLIGSPPRIFVGMAWEARSGLKQRSYKVGHDRLSVGMAWEARSGLKHTEKPTTCRLSRGVGMAWEARSGLKL